MHSREFPACLSLPGCEELWKQPYGTASGYISWHKINAVFLLGDFAENLSAAGNFKVFWGNKQTRKKKKNFPLILLLHPGECASASVPVCVGVVALLFYPFASWHICAPVLNKVSCKHTHTLTYKQHTHIPTYTHTVARGAQSFITFCCCCRFLFFVFWSFAICAAFRVPFPPTPCGIESQLVTFPSPSPPLSLFQLFYYRWCSFL